MNGKLTQQEYSELVKKMEPGSSLGKDMILAFIIGGAICCIGQLINFYFTSMKFNKVDAASLTSATLIFISALFTGIGLYDKLAKYGKAGTLVPITGFANSIVSPAMEYKTEGYILGVGSKMFIIAGPVLAYGISASVIYGIIYYFIK